MEPLPASVCDQIGVSIEGAVAIDEPDVQVSLPVTVRNGSSFHLDSRGAAPLNISYHWFAAGTGERVIWDGIRTPLVPEVPPHSSQQYELRVSSPDRPGAYRLQIALVQENVQWWPGPNGKVPEITLNLQRRPWWTEGAGRPVFGAQEHLNHDRFSPYLSHRGFSRPIALFCETVNICNNDCIICAYGLQTRTKKTMPLAVFEKILRDYSDLGGGHLSFTPVVGEVFLDKLLIDRVRLCEKYPLIKTLSVTTNGTMVRLLDDDELEFVLSRMRRVLVSIYGLDPEEFRVMTKKNDYDQFLLGLNRILKLSRGEVALGFRLLKPRPLEEVHEWVTNLECYGASRARIIEHTPTYEYGNWVILDTKTPLPFAGRWREVVTAKGQCMIPLLGCQVFSNGNVSFCQCDDFDNAESLHLGNIMESSLAELYNSDKVRRLWDWAGHGIPEFCRSCSYYRPITELRDAGDIFADPLRMAGA